MALDLSGFQVKPQEFGGLYKATESLEKRKLQEGQLAQQKEGRQAATTKFLTDYLDPKERLTGTNYDPEIVTGLQGVLQEGAALAAKGASTADIIMALGPKVNKINEYSTKAKLINTQIKQSAERLKGYGGYNIGALEDEAKKMAFQDEKGALKDISTIDPNMDWVTEATQKRPELVTTGAGLDQFVQKTPSATYERTHQTAYAGRTRNVKYTATHPFWEDLAKNEKGEVAVDPLGNPIGLDVVGDNMVGDDGKPMINPETKKPYRVMDKGHFTAVMQHNPDIADYVRGQVNTHFKEAGAKEIPKEGSPQWEMMARSILGDELKTRSKSSFKTIDKQSETGARVKVEIAQDPEMLAATKDYYSATRKPPGEGGDKVNKTTTYADVLTGVMNNEPDYSTGDIVDAKNSKGDIVAKNVMDITPLVPDLKYNNDQVYKHVYRNPSNNSLIVEKQNGEIEQVPEGKVYQFMNKLSGYNKLNPEYIRKTMEGSGFDQGKFSKAKPSSATQKIQEAEKQQEAAQAEKVKTFESTGKTSELSGFIGQKKPEGEIEKIETSGMFTSGKYYIDFKNGSRKSFKSKEELGNYLKGAKLTTKQPTPAEAPAAKSSSGSTGSGNWKSRAKKVQ